MLKKKKLLAWVLIILLCVNIMPQSFNTVHASEMDFTSITEELSEEVGDNEEIESSQIAEEFAEEQQILGDLGLENVKKIDYQTESDETPPAPQNENGSGNIDDGIENEISIASEEPMALASATGLSLTELRQKFPAGKYWNHAGNPGSGNSVNNQNGYTSTPCPKHKTVQTSAQTCNGFQPGSTQLSWQCMGYAEKLGYDATGYNPRNNANGWNTYTSSSALNNLKAGDIVRYKNDGHSIYVTDVNGDTVTYTDCNSDGHCIIRWGVTISKATLRSSFSYVRSAPKAQSPEAVSCSCSTSYAGNYVCTTSSANLNMRSGHGTSYGIVTAIPSGAVVYVSKSDGTWAHVSYNGYTGYASMQYLTKQNATPTRNSRVRTWISDTEMGNAVESVRTGEWVYLCYKMYDANTGDLFDSYSSAGYTVKLELFSPSGTLEHSAECHNDNNYIGIRRNIAGTYVGRVTVTPDNGNPTTVETSVEIIYEPRIETTVSSVDLNVLSTSSQTVSIGYSGATASDSIYVNTSKTGDCFTTSWGSWSNHVIPLTITGTKAGTGSVTIYLCDSDTDEILATKIITVSVEAPSYTVTYSASGGSGAPPSQEKDYGVSLNLSSIIPTRFGYNFVGWSTSSTAISAEYQPSESYSANEAVVLYAVWKQKEVSFTSSISETTNITYPGHGTYYKFTPNATTFYRFISGGDLDTKVCIYDVQGNQLATNDDGGENNNFELTYQLNSGTTYYIYTFLWNSSSTGSFSTTMYRGYKITYDTNGGNEIFAPEYYYRYYYGSDIDWSDVEKPTRTGHEFVGWNTKRDGTGKNYDLENLELTFISTLSANGGITLYAIWEPINSTYTISYNANGGSESPSSQIKTHGTNVTLSSVIPSRFGYNFLGWSTSSTATSANYLPGANFTTNATTTLYAVWESATTISGSVTNGIYSPVISYAEQYKYYSFTPSFSGKIRFESTGNSDTQIYLYNSTGAQLDCDDDDGDGNNFLLTYELSANIKYYIKVKYYGTQTGTISLNLNRVYDVIYHENGGSGAPSMQEKLHGAALTLSTTMPTRSGYDFLGWSTSSTATSASYQPGGNYTENGNVTLYAVWSANSYVIEYDANGGTDAPASQTKELGEDVTLSFAVPTRFGWDFKGWSTSSTVNEVDYQPGDAYTTDESVTLYAVWEQTEVSIGAENHLETTVNYPGRGVYYKVAPETTAFYRFRSTGDLDTRVYLYDASETKLAENDDGDEGLNFELTYQLEAGKTYYIYTRLYGNNTTGTFKTDMYRGYVISYDTNGGKETFASEYFYTYYRDDKLAEWSNVKTPTRDGYTFAEWNTTKDGSGAAFELENLGESWYRYLLQKGDTTLYAIWKKNDAYTNSFSDVPADAWYADEVQYVYEKSIMTGVSETLFDPETAVTRATIIQTLYKLEGKPAVDNFDKYNSLNDTPDSIWWKNGLAWALNAGVAKGDSHNNVFNPDNEVTREDLATFIYRYATKMGICGEFEGDVDAILNGTFVNEWARTAFAWAIDTGLIKGKTIGGVSDLAPQIGATRAELATIMMRFYENNDL